jgi:hypothetical protein
MILLASACGRIGFTPTGIEPNDDSGSVHDSFDLTTCPPSYTTTLATSISSSRYRISATVADFVTGNNACNTDLPGMTHLAALDSIAEADAINAVLPPVSVRYYVGAVQAPGETMFDTGWSLFTGEPLPGGLWMPGEPADGGGGPEGGAQQFGEYEPNAGLHDNSPDSLDGVVCECDGKAIPPAIAAEITAQAP